MEQMVIMQKSELADLIRVTVNDILNQRSESKAPRPQIKGIKALAEALNCSTSKAFHLKNSGAIRYFQDGKLLLFDYDQIMEDLRGKNLNKRGRRQKDGR